MVCQTLFDQNTAQPVIHGDFVQTAEIWVVRDNIAPVLRLQSRASVDAALRSDLSYVNVNITGAGLELFLVSGFLVLVLFIGV